MFTLGPQSVGNLKPLRPEIVGVVKRAIQITPVDFKVNEGLRSVTKQKENIAKGVSKTMNSRHLTGHAVDLVPWRDTDHDGDEELSWDWPSCYKIAAAMKQAANELHTQIVWGGVWDRPLNGLGPNLEAEVLAYRARRNALGDMKVFIDGPHFELNREFYP